MCYLVAKKFGDLGCVAFQTEHGKHLVSFESRLMESVGYDAVQLAVISRPSAYGEYEPYRFAETEAEFEAAVRKMQES